MTTKISPSILVVVFFLSACICGVNTEKQKRQIFREQLLPSKGGKIPEEAFRADRLALNRLNKEGITVPDGIVLEARYVHKHPGPASPMPEVLKVYLTPEGRYVPREGRYNYAHPKSVDTTYLVHRPIGSETQGKYKYRVGHNSVNKLERYRGGGGRGFGAGSVAAAAGYRESANPANTRQQLIYKPILRPLTIPSRDEFIQKTYYPSWSPDYSWDLVYEPFDDYFINGIAFFNSHQILTDYEGFLNDFHDRSSRHVPENGGFGNGAGVESSETFRDGINNRLSDGKINEGLKNSGYPDLRNIPETRFNCGDKRGTFADVETKCQVFHQCGAGGKSSFLCASGTIFSEVRKRCEWWDSVECSNLARNIGY